MISALQEKEVCYHYLEFLLESFLTAMSSRNTSILDPFSIRFSKHHTSAFVNFLEACCFEVNNIAQLFGHFSLAPIWLPVKAFQRLQKEDHTNVSPSIVPSGSVDIVLPCKSISKYKEQCLTFKRILYFRDSGEGSFPPEHISSNGRGASRSTCTQRFNASQVPTA